MSMWPDNLTVAPLLAWPRELTKNRNYSPFTAEWSSTLALLKRELAQVNARNVVLQVAIDPTQFRRDGRPRADARSQHPGVILSLDTPRKGSLQFPCDSFTTWQDNVRAIALSMEALRKMDRYGVTKDGQQYTGWKALNPGPSGLMSEAAAGELLRAYAPGGTDLRVAYKHAARKTHPDAGGNYNDFHRVQKAAAVLGLK